MCVCVHVYVPTKAFDVSSILFSFHQLSKGSCKPDNASQKTMAKVEKRKK
jgi:hypothetical protein